MALMAIYSAQRTYPMQNGQQTQFLEYAEVIAVLVATLPPERAAQVYDLSIT
jgi:hypothetical protein